MYELYIVFFWKNSVKSIPSSKIPWNQLPPISRNSVTETWIKIDCHEKTSTLPHLIDFIVATRVFKYIFRKSNFSKPHSYVYDRKNKARAHKVRLALTLHFCVAVLKTSPLRALLSSESLLNKYIIFNIGSTLRFLKVWEKYYFLVLSHLAIFIFCTFVVLLSSGEDF